MSSKRTITILRLIIELLAFLKDIEGTGEEVTDEEILDNQRKIKEAIKNWND